MAIHILFFGQLQDISTSFDMELKPQGMSVQEIEATLLSRFPKLKQSKYRMALNEEFVSADQTVKPGDELAFLPPFAGG